MSNPEIRFVANTDIDREKWDRCVAQSPYSIAYAFSWYLDRICTRWDALISGDYEFIMPLVCNKKYGFRYIYQPFFTQQLGVFSAIETSESIVNQFMKAIPESFRLVDMNLNVGNTLQNTPDHFRACTTYHLSLNSSLEKIQSAYNTNTKRNIQKALQNRLSASASSDIDRFISFTQGNLSTKAPEVKSQHYAAFQEIIRFALENKLGEIHLITNELGIWLAAVFFLKSGRTSIYLAASSTSEGIKKSAMFVLIDNFIQKNAGTDQILDFEGSNISGVARFYAGFGAKPQTYLSVHINRLPWFLRVLKK